TLELPNKELVEKLGAFRDLPVQVSYDAGAHMCETILRDLIVMSKEGTQFTPGFLHVPHTPDQLAASEHFALHKHSMPLDEQLRAVRSYLEVVAEMHEARLK